MLVSDCEVTVSTLDVCCMLGSVSTDGRPRNNQVSTCRHTNRTGKGNHVQSVNQSINQSINMCFLVTILTSTYKKITTDEKTRKPSYR